MARTVTLKGNPQTLEGNALNVGDAAPDFKLQGMDMSDVTLKASTGRVRIISTVPSVDTPVCDKETRRFNEEAAKVSNVDILTVSMDLPMAAKRWCAAAGIERVKMLSSHRCGQFGRDYGVLLKDGPLDRFPRPRRVRDRQERQDRACRVRARNRPGAELRRSHRRGEKGRE